MVVGLRMGGEGNNVPSSATQGGQRRRKFLVWRAPDLRLLDIGADRDTSAVENGCHQDSMTMTTSLDLTEDLDNWSPSNSPQITGPPLPASPAVNPTQVESWLDDHPAFTKEYFMRKATRQMVDAWLLSHAIKQKLQNKSNRKYATSVPASRSASGATTPVRKISAQEFERGGTLRPIVNTVDGTPTFIRSTDPVNIGQGRRSQRLSRSQLRKLDEKELIFELVKDICDDLDICSLCHKILKSLSELVHADRCSLFLVRGDKQTNTKHLRAQLFDVSSSSRLEESRGELRIPWGAGIAGYVAEHGATVNVPDAYQDWRFNPGVDARTGYHTRSLLCMPIKDASGEVIGIAQAVNKLGGGSFTGSDEHVFGSYLQLCGIALRNAQLYQQSQLERRRNEVLLDLARITLEEQSTIERVVQRILVHTLGFLQCCRAQVLICHDEYSETFSRAFDIEAADLEEEDVEFRETPHEGRFPTHVDICQRVIKTSQALHIGDVYDSDLFDASVDDGQQFRHKSILCQPIIGPADTAIGVIQLVNKQDGGEFTANDMQFLDAFAIFCGIGISNTRMYEKAATAVAKQLVTMEILSYHCTASLHESQILNSLPVPSARSLKLEMFCFDDVTLSDQDTLRACLRMVTDTCILERFQIDRTKFCRWLMTVRNSYRNVTYHNWRHAFNVCQMMYAMLMKSGWWERLGDLESFGLLIACLCHDLDHRGTNNSFQTKVASPLARLYSSSILERHHLDRCIMILNSQGVDILSNVSPNEYTRIVQVVESAIISTDLTLHLRNRSTFINLVESEDLSWDLEEHRALLRSSLTTVCDISAIAKPWEIQHRVAQLVASEFFEQGDIERQQLHITPLDFMDREKGDRLPKMQVDFIDYICLPVIQAICRLSPELGPLLQAVQHNRREWSARI